MLENQFTEPCEIWSCSKSDDGFERKTWRKDRDASCFYIPRQGRKVVDDAGQEVVTSGDFLLTEEIDIHNERVVYGGYMYEGVTITAKREIFAMAFQIYVVSVSKRRKIDEIQTSIS